jgi:hypothetical protein
MLLHRSRDFPSADAHVDGAGCTCNCGDKSPRRQYLANEFRKDISLRRGQGALLDDQVVVAGSACGCDQVHADGGRRATVVGGRELVDDRGYAIGNILRCLRILNGFGWN